ncbi:MAG: alpha/beta fold hydrolase [Dehalococcoidia bacterium]|nr:MAG: alpha/beta fold hydrolase [Dehalococcoidia bacterium]
MPRAYVNGINIYYNIEGQGEPLVLIMGYSGGLIGWVFQRRAFGKHNRIITLDNRGVGKTDKPGGAYSMKMMADDTVGLMDHLGIEKAHICGMSMGGMIAQEIAINYPERVGKLVLGCTAARRTDSLGAILGLGEGYTDDDIRALPIMKFVNSLYSYGFNKCLYRIFMVPMAKVYARFSSPIGLTVQLEAVLAHNTLDRLHMIGAPTLVITGTEDRLVPPSSSEALANGIPNARLVRIEGGSHSFFIEMRGRANREILDFLRDG